MTDDTHELDVPWMREDDPIPPKTAWRALEKRHHALDYAASLHLSPGYLRDACTAYGLVAQGRAEDAVTFLLARRACELLPNTADAWYDAHDDVRFVVPEDELYQPIDRAMRRAWVVGLLEAEGRPADEVAAFIAEDAAFEADGKLLGGGVFIPDLDDGEEADEEELRLWNAPVTPGEERNPDMIEIPIASFMPMTDRPHLRL